MGTGTAREIDAIIVGEKRVFVVDIKDLHGRVESVDGAWIQNGGIDLGPSPVAKINDNARSIATLLKSALAKRPETRTLAVPKVEGLVVLTGRADRSGIAETESSKVLTIDEFITSVSSSAMERTTYGNVAPDILATPLTDPFWKDRLSRFFNAGPSSPFKPGRRRFQRYTAEEAANFQHPNDIYREYEAQEDGTPPIFGTLRLWNFGKIPDARFQTEAGRREIAGRERQVYHWLRDRNVDFERTLLTPRIDDAEIGVNYWEIYDRRRRMKRLGDFAASETASLSDNQLVELARQVLSVVAELHRHSASHLDLGAHSIWLEAPTSVRLSHLFASKFPAVQSLGAARYHFLASMNVPEDVLGQDAGPERRDVYLIGVALHQLLFGVLPEGDPPEWSASVDAKGRFVALHDWFAESLDIDPNQRFANGAVALEAFNRATAERPTVEEIASGLDRFRSRIRSQLTLLQEFPLRGDPIKSSDSIDVWQSAVQDQSTIVKMWKHAAWGGDIRKDGARVLAFLERAEELKADRPPAIPAIRDVLWLGDAFAVVQDWVPGKTLSEWLREPPEQWRTPAGALAAASGILEAVERTHESDIAHGDLKPDNVVISDGGEVFMIDVLDFTSKSDGEIQNSAYSGGHGDRFSRDRYAVTKMADELFSLCVFAPEHAAKLSSAIEDCRSKEPRLASLKPLQEAMAAVRERLDEPLPSLAPVELKFAIPGATVGPLVPDEGLFHVRLYPADTKGPATFHIRGAAEEIEIRFRDDGTPFSARRRRLSQTRISITAKHEFHRFAGEVSVTRADHLDLDDLESIFDDPAVSARMTGALSAGTTASTGGESDAEVAPEEAQEQLIEEIAADADTETILRTDVPLLWRTLVEIEKDLTTEGVAVTNSARDATTGRHRVGFDLETGAFDFNRNDTVGVLRQDRRGGWRRIGELDIRNSHANAVMIDATEYGGRSPISLVEAGQRLQFVSHYETESLRRRTDAVDRILKGKGRATNLLSVFDPRSGMRPLDVPHEVDEVQLKKYQLNADQIIAFRKLVQARPVGLLQGPPGTGKTRFIAALAHYALTKGLARNVLLSSQSHEAVNTAGEALLALFRKSGGEPSMLRVAMNDDQVSDQIRPYHTMRVEQAFKDRFEASFRERLAVAAGALGLPEDVAREVLTVEAAIRSIAGRMAELAQDDEPDLQRINGLKESLAGHLDTIGIDRQLADEVGEDAEGYVRQLCEVISTKPGRTRIAPDKIARLGAAVRLGRDFIGSAFRAQRSFEPFLAGTRQVVVGTCVGLGRASLGLVSNPFDLVIVDEAARCTASELLVPLQAARWAVLVGDQAQLEPNHEAEVVNRVAAKTDIPKKEILRSDFERVFLTDYGAAAGERLKTQYRMLPPIGKLVSEVFYPDLTLTPGRSDPAIDPAVLPAELSHALTWVETDGLGETGYDRKLATGSRTNRIEANAILALLNGWCGDDAFQNWMRTQTVAPVAVGVICMYAAQRDLIHQLVMRSALGVLLGKQLKVGTVDSYQGKENPIVLLSLVRNNADGPRDPVSPTIGEGFLASPNRINVAASRAMDRLVIVGARRRWAVAGPMGRVSKAFGDRETAGEARTISAESLLETNQPTRAGKKSAVQKSPVATEPARG